ncbi:hypothetical protein [Deinococcus altitudinis]|uniref:hypothetical protein n=1 Tax=Deinococcus altitudinis TaxID=468914 RepID=UPI0038914481
MKLRYLPAPDIDTVLLEDIMAYLLSGFVAAPGQRLISNEELFKMASRSLSEVHIELVRRSRIQVDLDG